MTEDDLKATLNLELFPQLRRLGFEGMRFSRDRTVNLVPVIWIVLSTAVADSRLNVLTATVNVETSRDGTDMDWDCWAPVDEYLSDAKRFPFFECLEVALVIRKKRFASSHVSLLRERLWRLAATNRVRISVEL